MVNAQSKATGVSYLRRTGRDDDAPRLKQAAIFTRTSSRRWYDVSVRSGAAPPQPIGSATPPSERPRRGSFGIITDRDMTQSSNDQWLDQLSMLEARLAPIANRKVDLSEPGWADRLRHASPLDDAGIRRQAEDLLQEMIDAYAIGDEVERTAIRSLFRTFTAFAWAATLRLPRLTAEGFRAHLLHFSVLDQGTDPRDATLWLDDLVASARRADVDVEPTLREVAALSSREPRYDWGSTRKWLLDRTASEVP